MRRRAWFLFGGGVVAASCALPGADVVSSLPGTGGSGGNGGSRTNAGGSGAIGAGAGGRFGTAGTDIGSESGASNAGAADGGSAGTSETTAGSAGKAGAGGSATGAAGNSTGGASTGGRSTGGNGGAAGSGAGVAGSAGAGGSGPRCSPQKPFQLPVLVPSLLGTSPSGSPINDGGARLSPDELTVYFSSSRTSPKAHIYRASRSNRDAAFSAITELTELNDATNPAVELGFPSVTSNGLEIYYSRPAPDATHGVDLFLARRNAVTAPFVPSTFPDSSGIPSQGADDYDAFILPDGSALYFTSNRPINGVAGTADLWMSPKQGNTFAPPTQLTTVNSNASERSPALSANGLTLYFASTRSTPGTQDVYVARRNSVAQPFAAPQQLTEFANAEAKLPSWISTDDCVMYLTAQLAVGTRIYSATRPR